VGGSRSRSGVTRRATLPDRQRDRLVRAPTRRPAA
jgi:hypothetical protein